MSRRPIALQIYGTNEGEVHIKTPNGTAVLTPEEADAVARALDKVIAGLRHRVTN